MTPLPHAETTARTNQPISENTLVYLENIYKIYGSGNTEVCALSDVTLEIQKGEYCAIMGASGSGKSTLMNIVGCLDRPSRGRYYLDRLDISQVPEAELAQIRNRKIGFVFQQFHLLPHFSAMENVMLPMVYAGTTKNEREQRAQEVLQRVGLGNRIQNQPSQLSGGQQQRVAIARAIVNQPDILLADEPTGALDSHTTEEIITLFGELNDSGITVIMVTHEADVARHSKRIVWFQDGKVLHTNLHPSNLKHAMM
ncbi:ABC transporter ATP-binding protein [Geitlerinema sp. PCC 9228]|uniref:ABC transporter ATP-binding protein n=1 Tax=Geitlerinema sp. PCC 9228 TaxID=111611 RepID=UPI0008F9D5D6|nr:ABC transporter ATP-binding protein [Geitlerinema sp. PCC 9228]